jgi:tetratricopeptide (TPR) repeat protein
MTSTPDSFLLGNSFVRSPSSYISPSSRKTANRRFFESVPAGTQQQSGCGISNSSSNEFQSEIDLGQIRALAMSAMGTESSSSSPEMAVFYCSILFSKTQSGADAYFYASALYRNREYRRAVRVLDEFLDDNLEAALLACQCLSEIGEWQEASQLLQEASRLPQSTTILLDEDENGWETLYKMFPVKSGDIHVVARLLFLIHLELNYSGKEPYNSTTSAWLLWISC